MRMRAPRSSSRYARCWRLALCTALVACGGGPSDAGSSDVPAVSRTPSAIPATSDRTSYRAALDRDTFDRFPDAFARLAAAATPRSADGLLDRNFEWRGLYSPRFQLGAGRALRHHLARGHSADARRAWAGITAAMPAIGADGTVRSTLPATLFPGHTLSEADRASGAAFFLGDACLGVLALQADIAPDAVASASAQAEVTAALTRAIGRLRNQADLLRDYDAKAPNRLLFDALAFQACGALAGDEAAKAQAGRFVSFALGQQAADGHFVEGGGTDTSYHAVALDKAAELLVAGFPSDVLSQPLAIGAEWLAARIGADGRVDSSGNSRSCGGGETFLGEAKGLSLPSVFSALAFVGTSGSNAALVSAAQRVYAWVDAHPGADTCHAPRGR